MDLKSERARLLKAFESNLEQAPAARARWRPAA